jgi:hypothetical protein
MFISNHLGVTQIIKKYIKSEGRGICMPSKISDPSKVK